jgi:bleomycin hydrolase
MRIALLALIVFLPVSIWAQEKTTDFKEIIKVPATAVENQNSTGTCWSFATSSFLTSELLRKGKGELNLSEMYFVRNAYLQKAKEFIMYHGNANFGEGGQAHDVMNVLKNSGMMPEIDYPGKRSDQEKHDHSKMVEELRKFALKTNKNFNETKAETWESRFSEILDSYLGTVPSEFTFNGKQYSPTSFANMLGINPDDYIEITSFNHHPFYEEFDLEIPDNWSHDQYYNVPVDELVEIMDSALYRGYSVCWDGDTSEKTFKHRVGSATLEPEVKFDQQARQTTFINRNTSDDHLMHVVGISEDETGAKYYLTKNSWGTEKNPYGGYLYMSEPYVRLKTIALLVHKNAVPRHILKKLNIP